MKPDQQVCSLEPAKRLKELGIKQDSYFAWVEDQDTIGAGGELGGTGEFYLTQKQSFQEGFSAFTVAELGEMLPRRIKGKASDYTLAIKHNAVGGWLVFYEEHDGDTTMERRFADTEADARAKMLIYLLENKLISPEE